MSLLRIDPGIMIWTWISFGLVIAILGATTWKRIIKALNSRADKINSDLLAAEKTKEDAKNSLASYREKIDSVKEEARVIIESAKLEANLARDKIIKDANEKAEQNRLTIMADINASKEEALSSLKNESVELAAYIAESILKRNIEKEDHNRLIDEFISDMAKTKNKA